MKLETVVKRKNQGETMIGDCYSSARYGATSYQLTENINNRIASLGKIPQWAVQYLRGYSAALLKVTYRDSLIFGGYYDGVFYSVDSSRADYYGHTIPADIWARNNSVKKLGHYWKTTAQPMPFFVRD